MLSKRFPFGIYYEMEDAEVYVYAILDLRRGSGLDSETIARLVTGRFVIS